MKNREIIFEIGQLKGFGSLHCYLAPKIEELRKAYIKGSRPKVYLDLRELVIKKISIAGLSALLGSCKRIRSFLTEPISILIEWEPELLSFLHSINFLEISNEFDIFTWPKEFMGGYDITNINSLSKILYVDKILPYSRFRDRSEFDNARDILNADIRNSLSLPTFNLLRGIKNIHHTELLNILCELITNSLSHGEEIAFIALQRTKKRITISVCDSGLGFYASLIKQQFNIKNDEFKYIRALILGSIKQKEDYGLKNIINFIIKAHEFTKDLSENLGWVTMSTFDSLIRWQRSNWKDLLENIIDTGNYSDAINDVFIDNMIKKFTMYGSQSEKGLFKKYKFPLRGSRITFEYIIDKE